MQDTRDCVARTTSLVALCVLSLLLIGAGPSSDGERWALVIGIDGYQTLGQLEYCAADARALADVLVERCGYDANRVVVLTDGGDDPARLPTLAGIRRRIAQIARLADEGDTILVFFSGHGITRGGEGYLVPVDGDAQNAVSLSWVKGTLEDSEADCKLLVLDACHAGSAAKGVSGIAPSLAAGPGLVMLLSSEREQVSYPTEDRRHSVFTRHLVDGLAGGAADEDGTITAEGLHAYVAKHMKEWSFQSGRMQTPVLVGQGAAGAVLGRIPQRLLGTPWEPTGAARPDLTVHKGWPFDGQEARRRQQETARALGVRPELTLDLGGGVAMDLVLIPAGEFMMGSSPDEEGRHDDEGPQHRVQITRPFYMGRCEVTNAQYQQFVRDSSYGGRAAARALKHQDNWQKHASRGADHPVVAVSWGDAQAFCRWLSRKTGRQVRLPTEAEWEYACRAGSTTAFHFGDSASRLDEYGWYVGNSAETTHRVGQKGANRWGLYDMHGNVWEWCADWYAERYRRETPLEDPKGPSASEWRVMRGGSWFNGPERCRSAVRGKVRPTDRLNHYGFRVVMQVGPSADVAERTASVAPEFHGKQPCRIHVLYDAGRRPAPGRPCFELFVNDTRLKKLEFEQRALVRQTIRADLANRDIVAIRASGSPKDTGAGLLFVAQTLDGRGLFTSDGTWRWTHNETRGWKTDEDLPGSWRPVMPVPRSPFWQTARQYPGASIVRGHAWPVYFWAKVRWRAASGEDA